MPQSENTYNLFVIDYQDYNKDSCLKLVQSMMGEDQETPDFNIIAPIPPELIIEPSDDLYDAMDYYKTMHIVYLKNLKFDILRESTREMNILDIPDSFVKKYRQKHPISDEMFEYGKQGYQNLMLFNHPTWYDWCDRKWGTPQNAMEGKYKNEPEKNRIILKFQTLHNYPSGIISILAANNFLPFKWYYYNPATNRGGLISWDGMDIKHIIKNNDEAFAKKVIEK